MILYGKYKKLFWLGIIIPGIQQLSGINTIGMYASRAFESQPNSSYLLPLTVSMETIFSILIIPVINRIGRRTLSIIGALVSTISYLMCYITLDESGKSTTKNWIFNIGAMISVGIFSASYGAVMYFNKNK